MAEPAFNTAQTGIFLKIVGIFSIRFVTLGLKL